MIIVDTSVWIDHIRQSIADLEQALLGNSVLLHPYVLGEIALGSIASRVIFLEELQKMPFAMAADEREVLELIERERLFGSGIGYVDVHLLASTRLHGDCKLWTHDKRLGAVAQRLGISHEHVH